MWTDGQTDDGPQVITIAHPERANKGIEYKRFRKCVRHIFFLFFFFFFFFFFFLHFLCNRSDLTQVSLFPEAFTIADAFSRQPV